MIIYKATNKINGKCYIGQTRHSLDYRKRIHLTKAHQGIDTHFYQAIRKYGDDNFEWSIICSANDKKTLNELETYYIQKYDSIRHGYNMVDGGDNNVMDIESVKTKHDMIMQSAEIRKKISDSMKQYRKDHPFTDEHRAKLSEKAKGNHNFGNPDTRSVACHCVDIETDTTYYFHNYLEAGEWWYETFRPFPYSESTYQRKIKQSINQGFVTYGRGSKKKVILNPIWYKGGDLDAEEVTNS